MREDQAWVSKKIFYVWNGRQHRMLENWKSPSYNVRWSPFRELLDLFLELDFWDESLSDIGSHVGSYFGSHGCCRDVCIFLGLRSEAVQELISSQGLSVALHQHLHASLVMRRQISDSSEYGTRHISHSRDLDSLRLSQTESQFSEF